MQRPAPFAFAPLAVVFGLAAPVMAAERVVYTDLDLSRAEDAAAFAARVDAAADVLCKTHRFEVPSLSPHRERDRCRVAAREEAMRQLPSDERRAYAQTLKTTPTQIRLEP